MKFKYVVFIFFFSINCFAHHPGNKIEADKPYPSINLTVIKDKIDGYNIFIDIQNFNLNPSEIGNENISNSGYLQLFINDIRITRIYLSKHTQKIYVLIFKIDNSLIINNIILNYEI